MFDSFFAREPEFSLALIPQYTGIHWKATVLLLSFSFEYIIRHSIISIDVLIFWLTIARIAASEFIERSALSNLSQTQFSCCKAIFIASTSPSNSDLY